MEDIKKMQKFGREIILADDSHLEELKSMIDDFFKDKDQNYFNSLNQDELKRIISLSEKIRILNEISRAYLDYVFNKDKPKKYAWVEVEGKFSKEKIRLIKDIITKEANLDDADNKGINDWIEWLINDDVTWDDASFENKDKNLHIEIDITGYSEVPEIKIFVIGDKKYKMLMNEIQEILKQ